MGRHVGFRTITHGAARYFRHHLCHVFGVGIFASIDDPRSSPPRVRALHAIYLQIRNTGPFAAWSFAAILLIALLMKWCRGFLVISPVAIRGAVRCYWRRGRGSPCCLAVPWPRYYKGSLRPLVRVAPEAIALQHARLYTPERYHLGQLYRSASIGFFQHRCADAHASSAVPQGQRQGLSLQGLVRTCSAELFLARRRPVAALFGSCSLDLCAADRAEGSANRRPTAGLGAYTSSGRRFSTSHPLNRSVQPAVTLATC